MNKQPWFSSILSSSGRLSCLLAIAYVMVGCAAGPRKPTDMFIPPPEDPGREIWEKELEAYKDSVLLHDPFTNYQIGPGDVISISLLGRTDLFSESGEASASQQFEITENPFIVLPHIGTVNVHGKTAEQLENELKVAFERVIKNPSPVVSIRNYASNYIVVLGGVTTPGRYPLEKNDSLLEGIFKAGGLSFGGRDHSLPPAQILKVYRLKSFDETAEDGGGDAVLDRLETPELVRERKEIIIPLDEFILGGDLSYNIPLQSNDIVYIPPAGTVVVHGQVKNPRVVFLGPGLRTLTQVLTEVGGLKFRAASMIEIVRFYPDGSVESFYMNIRKVRDRRERDFVLRDNDQVFVYTNNWRAFWDIMGNVFSATANTGVNATYSPVP